MEPPQKKRKYSQGPLLTRFDITLPKGEIWPNYNAVHKYLKEWCSSYIFQEEKSDSGYEHFQGRVSLIKQRRSNELKGKFCVGGNFEPTTNKEYRNASFAYVMKADSRVAGPWDDRSFREPPPLTRQLISFLKLEKYPWQQQVEEMAKLLDDRKIRLIYDIIGDAGKSIFAEYLEYYGIAYEVPPFRSMEDILACAMEVGAQPCYLIDMPRGMKKDKLGEFYSGLETLKNGVAYDKRYKFRKVRFDRPQIIVFTNSLPVWNLMSPGRWDVWEMQNDKSLKKYHVPPN